MLHEEEVVVDKRTVPKERVRMDKTSPRRQQVSETVRKERSRPKAFPAAA